MITIIHAERYQLFREGVHMALLPYRQEFQVIAEAESFDGLFSALQNRVPDVLIISHMLRDGLTCEYVEFLHDKYPEMKIVVLTMAFCEDVMLSVFKYVHAFLGKHASTKELVHTIRKVHNGESYFTLPGWSIIK